MGKITLSSCEILYLSTIAGATEFMGIPDGFYGMDELEIKQEILKIHADLEKRRYAQTDFDGNFEASAEVMQLIEICALCEKYISVDKTSAASGATKLLFYFYNNNIVKIDEVAGKFELTLAQPADIGKSILENISWLEHIKENADGKVVIPQSLLEQVKDTANSEFSEKAGEDALNKVGCTNGQAKIIYSGLVGTANYISVIIVDFTSQENDVMSIMVVNSSTGSLELLPVDIDEKAAIEFRTIDYDMFKNKLTAALATIGILDGGGDFE